MISPTLYFSIIFALSSFLNDEIISLRETQAFPLTLSNFIKANFGARFIYDDDIDAFDINDAGEEVNVGPKLQIKQLLGVGLVYSF